MYAAKLVLLFFFAVLGNAKAKGLCETENGQPSLIFDIEESRGTEISQETKPREIPIYGDPFADIHLDLIFPKKKQMFILNGKKLQLLRPLDRDKDNLSHTVFQLTCTVRTTGKKVTIPVIMRVTDVNDNAPVFEKTPYETTVSELTPVGTTVFQGLKAVDMDAGVNGLVEYRLVKGDPPQEERLQVADGADHFAINLPHQGQITVSKPLDYEKVQRYLLTVIATDKARNQGERFTATTTMTVNVKDEDDLDPSFIYQGCMLVDGACINPEYYATVNSGVLAGVLSITPEKIQAVDMDSLNKPIVYSFLSGTPSNYADFFEIDSSTGIVQQIKPVDTNTAKRFVIIVKATEFSNSKRFATAKLFINVKPVDSSPPIITATAKEGFVDENSPVGTRILDVNKMPIKLTVSDADLGQDDPKPPYAFELTTTFFQVDSNGILVVGEENLDRDPPSPGVFRFQVVAREKTGGGAASPPLTLTVILNDVNDNAPRLPMFQPISVQAGDNHREIIKVTATDNDSGENAMLTYSIYHVSNNGRNKFSINSQSGVLDSVGKLNAGEQYSITVQATDSGGKAGQTIVEVNVVPGPNTRSPVFDHSVYEVTVSEGAAINSTVATITASDPENEEVMYSIISGNDLRQFAINDRSGVISVIRKLDREDLTRYQLLIKAEDEGGLSSTATVNIRVSDINDKNPEFVNLPYEFSVKEGLVGIHVGKVKANDADEGINSNVTYSLPLDVPFTINPQNGDVMTSTSLDYEKEKEYKFVVTAMDGAPDPRIATATVTIHVLDTEDELPIFHNPLYKAEVPENMPNYTVTQVKADDPDTTKQITYTIKQGPNDMFKIDPVSGVIKTIKGIDYELESQYILIVGTLENNTTKPGSTTKVVVNIVDVNDIPPVFLTIPTPITLDDNVKIGTKVTTLMATDSDGTSPGNKVRYEIVGRNKALKYFHIDSDLGEVTVRDDLSKETDDQYQVDVKAYDLGDPQLSSITSVTIFVRHIAQVHPDVVIGFSEDSYTVELPEDAPEQTLIKTFTVLNDRPKNQHIPIKCTIQSGDEAGIFSTNVTGEKNCELRLAQGKLDHEITSEYILKLRLDTLADYVSQENRSTTTVKVQVIDINDNSPHFVYPSYSKLFKKEKYFGAIAKDKKEVRTVLQVKAEDKDSGKLGMMEYRIVPDDKGMSEYFSIEPLTGNIKTKRSIDSILPESLPIRLTIEAKDNPQGVSNTATTEVVINVIEDADRIIMAIKDLSADKVQHKEDSVVDLLEQRTGLIIGLEKLSPLESTKDNITLNTDTTGTDVWFYAIDPQTEKILPRNSTLVEKTVFSEDVIANVTAELSTDIGGQVVSLHGPLKVRVVRTAVVAVQWDVFPYAVILIAALILVLGSAGIVYICISWSRYKAYKERMQRMYVMPRYDPVFVEPNLKEYETQVLQMSVPMDDSDSYHDLQLDFSRKNHAFSLDNVSYITKDHGEGGQSPVSSEAATTARASSIGRHNNINNNNIHDHSGGNINPVYDRSDDEAGHNTSPTNENVTFREKKDYSHLGFNYLMDRSPIETTTEL
ncbi:cadherin-99C isoform X2 [Cimex lectularius]|nr:cadherin-99C isoform X2 [Cimex lectularius]XP_014256145.1 cadherin-99C isoform X2 [Cimex lectularius]XP_014256146.1 cadherin-99C isoform X2 [Cimex lectularius]